MKRFFLFALILALFGTKAAFNQQVYRLQIYQPPPVTLILAERIITSAGTVINLDTLFHVQGDITYQREWKFRDGEKWETIDNPILTLNRYRVFYLTLIDNNKCTIIDSVTFDVAPGIDLNHSKASLQSIKVYPNPNNGSFDIKISECMPGFSIQIINAIGVQILHSALDCTKDEYSERITIPGRKPGIYYLLVKKDNIIINRQKVILLTK